MAGSGLCIPNKSNTHTQLWIRYNLIPIWIRLVHSSTFYTSDMDWVCISLIVIMASCVCMNGTFCACSAHQQWKQEPMLLTQMMNPPAHGNTTISWPDHMMIPIISINFNDQNKWTSKQSLLKTVRPWNCLHVLCNYAQDCKTHTNGRCPMKIFIMKKEQKQWRYITYTIINIHSQYIVR